MDETLPRPAAVPTTYPTTTASTARLPRWAGDALAVSVLLATLLVAAGISLQGARGLYRLDVVTFYLPWYSHLGERLRDLDIPGWLPYTMSGVPFAGDPQSGWGYLPAMIIFTIAPGVAGFKAFVLFHVLLAGLSTYAFARAIGLGAMGALTAAVGFALGNFLQRTVCCTIHMQVAVWVPVALLGVEMAMRAERWTARLRWLLLAGVACSQIMAGWIGQGAYYGMLAVGAYLAFRTLGSRDRPVAWWARPRDLLVGGAVLLTIGLSLAAPALLPRLDVISRSNLADLYEEGDAASTDEEGWRLDTMADRLLSDRTRNGHWYLGAAMLTAALAAPWVAGRQRRVVYLAVFAVAVLSLTLRVQPLGDLLGYLPRFDDLHRHLPDRILVVVYIAPAILAGALVHRLVAREPVRPRWWQVVGIVAVPVAVMVGAEVVLRGAPVPTSLDPKSVDPTTVVIGGTLLAAILLGILARSRSVRVVAAVSILGMMVVDPAGRYLAEISGDERRDQLLQERVDNYVQPNGAARWLQARTRAGDHFRYYGYDPAQLVDKDVRRTYHVTYQDPVTSSILVNNRSVDLSLQDIQGYNPVQIARYVNLFEAVNAGDQSYHAANVLYSGSDSLLLDMLNVRYLVVPGALPIRDPRDGEVVRDEAGAITWLPTIPAGRPDLLHLSQRMPTVYQDETNRILESPSAMPRAWFVHEADKVRSSEQLPKWQLRLVDPATTALTENTLELEPPGDAVGELVTVESYEPDRITLRVAAASRGLVVLSEIWDPGWEAEIDGEATRVYRVNYAMRGVVVEAGTHEIVLHYDPPVLRESMLIALGGLALLLFGLVATWLWDRRHPVRHELPPAAHNLPLRLG